MIKNLKKKITHTSNNNTDSTSTANQDAKLDALSKLYSKELSKSNQLLSDREILESNLLNKEKLLVDQSKQLAVMQKMLNSYKKNVSTENSLFEREYNLWLDEKSKYENKINALQSQLTDNCTIEKDTKEEEEEVEIKNSFLGFVENLQNSLIHSTSSMLNSEKNPDDSTVADNDDNKSEISFSNEHGSDIHSTSSSLVDESLEIQNDEDNELPEPSNNSVLINDLKSDLKDASQKLAELNNVYNKMTSDHNTMLTDKDHSHTFNTSEISDNNFDISVDDIDYDYDDNENNDVLRNAIINVDYQKLKTLEMELDDHSTDDDNNSVLAITHRLSKNNDSLALAATDNASILHKFGDLNEELNYSKELNFSLLLFVNQLVKDVEHLQHNNNVEDNQVLLDAKTNNALTVVKRFDDGIVNHEINEHLQTVKNFLESHNYDNINKFPHPLRKKASRLTITATENLDNQEEANSKIKKSTSAKSLNDSHHHNSFLPTRRLTKFFKKNNSVNSEVSNSNSIANSSRIVSFSSTASISSSSTKTNTNINTDVTTPTSSPMKTNKNVNTVHYDSSDSPSTSALLNSSNVITSHTDGVDMIENSPSPLKNKSINKRHSSHHPSITRTLSNKVHERSSNKSLSNRISRVLSNNIHSNFSLDKHHDNNNDAITTSKAENDSTKKNTEQKRKTIIELTKDISEINSAVPDIVPHSTSSNATFTGSSSDDAVHKAKSVETMDTFSSIPSVMAKNDSVSESRKNHINDEVDCSVPSKIISDSNDKSRTFNNDPVVSIKHKKAVITKVEIIDHEENEKDLEQQTLDLHDQISDILEVDEEQEEPEEVIARSAGPIVVVNEDPLNAEHISNLAAASRGSVVIADPAEYVNNAANTNQSIDSLIHDDSPDGKISNDEPAVDKNAENDHDTSNTNLHSSSSDIHSQNSTIFSKSNDAEEIQHSLHDEDGHASQEVDSGNQDKCTADSYLDIELLNHSETLSDDIKSNETVNNKVMDTTSVIESIYEMIMKETSSMNKGISQSENNNSVIMESKNKNEKADSYEIMRNILNDHHQLVNNKNLLSNIHSYLLLNGQHDADYLQNYPILKMLLSKHVSHESNDSLMNSEFKNINELID